MCVCGLTLRRRENLRFSRKNATSSALAVIRPPNPWRSEFFAQKRGFVTPPRRESMNQARFWAKNSDRHLSRAKDTPCWRRQNRIFAPKTQTATDTVPKTAFSLAPLQTAKGCVPPVRKTAFSCPPIQTAKCRLHTPGSKNPVFRPAGAGHHHIRPPRPGGLNLSPKNAISGHGRISAVVNREHSGTRSHYRFGRVFFWLSRVSSHWRMAAFILRSASSLVRPGTGSIPWAIRWTPPAHRS
jgi:hypothetical protein